MLRIYRIIRLAFVISMAQALHFFGGTVTWKPMNKSATGSKISVMFTQSYQWKRSVSVGALNDYCDQTIINNKSPLIPNSAQNLVCVTTPCSNGYAPISVNGYCTDFSATLDSSSGQSSALRNITAGSKFCVAFQDGNWMTVLATGNCDPTSAPIPCWTYLAHWSIATCVDLTVRVDGFINTPPVATVISRM